MVKVKNLNGTTDNFPPKGYSTWKSWWEDKKGKKFETCSCNNCRYFATLGAHVQKVSMTDKKWYIVPLCSSCNKKSSDEVFEVREYDLVAVNS